MYFNRVITDYIKYFFKLLMILIVKAIKKENYYNIDKIGIIERLRLNSLVFRSLKIKIIFLKTFRLYI